jgi:hypothetical protein
MEQASTLGAEVADEAVTKPRTKARIAIKGGLSIWGAPSGGKTHAIIRRMRRGQPQLAGAHAYSLVARAPCPRQFLATETRRYANPRTPAVQKIFHVTAHLDLGHKRSVMAVTDRE